MFEIIYESPKSKVAQDLDLLFLQISNNSHLLFLGKIRQNFPWNMYKHFPIFNTAVK